MFRTVPLTIIRSLALYTHIIGTCHTCLLQSWYCWQAISKPVWHIPFLCVQWKTPDDGQKTVTWVNLPMEMDNLQVKFVTCSLHLLESLASLLSCGVQLKCDGTRWRTGREVKGKLANGVGSQYPSHYLGTWCIQHYYRWCAHLGCQ